MNLENNMQEGTAMTTNRKNNTKLVTINNTNVSKVAMVPKDELAVADSLILTTPNMPSFSSLVLPDEIANELVGNQNSTERYKELGFFSPIRGMVNISNRLDGKLYAKLYENENGQRNIEYVQEYVNERYSPKMSLSQAGIRIAAQYGFSSEGIQERKIRSKISNFILEANEDYYGKFRGVKADELDVADILNTLYEALPHLPVISGKPSELEEEDFYQSLDFHIKELPYLHTREHKSYYPLEEEEIETLAGKMDMKKLELLKKLKQYDFLYLVSSSKGYQTNVRIKFPDGKTYTEWRYCIYKLSYFADIEEVTESLGTDF